MKQSLPLLLLALGLSGCVQRSSHDTFTMASGRDSIAFFVATNGNDQWSGKFPSPNASSTDGPFATLPRAFKAVREQVRLNERTNGERGEVTDPSPRPSPLPKGRGGIVGSPS